MVTFVRPGLSSHPSAKRVHSERAGVKAAPSRTSGQILISVAVAFAARTAFVLRDCCEAREALTTIQFVSINTSFTFQVQLRRIKQTL